MKQYRKLRRATLKRDVIDVDGVIKKGTEVDVVEVSAGKVKIISPINVEVIIEVLIEAVLLGEFIKDEIDTDVDYVKERIETYKGFFQKIKTFFKGIGKWFKKRKNKKNK